MPPRKLKKAGTMQQASAEGSNYLKRSWGEDKYELVQTYLKARDDVLGEGEKKEEPAPKVEPAAKKPKLTKSGTMAVTTKESEVILKDADIDTDAKTRNQAKIISSITKKKPRVSKKKTMIATAKESEVILKDANIDADAKTRKQAKDIKTLKAPKKPRLSKKKTMLETAKESEAILKDTKIDSDAKTRNQSKQIEILTTPKPKLKKAGTMAATAQEALNLLTQEPLKPRNSKAAAKPKKGKAKTKRLQKKKATKSK